MSAVLLAELETAPLWLRLAAARCIFERERSPSAHLQAAIQAPIQELETQEIVNVAHMLQVKAESSPRSCVGLLNAGLVSASPEIRSAAYRMAGSLSNLSIPLGRRALTIIMKRCLTFESSDVSMAAGIAVVCELQLPAAVHAAQVRKWIAALLPKLRGNAGTAATPIKSSDYRRSFAVLTLGICQWCLLRQWGNSEDTLGCFVLLLRHAMADQIQSLVRWTQEAESTGREDTASWALTTPMSIILQAVTATTDEYSTQALLCRCLVRLGAATLPLLTAKSVSEQPVHQMGSFVAESPAQQQAALLQMWCGPALDSPPGQQVGVFAINVALVRMLASLLPHAWLMAACDDWSEAGHTVPEVVHDSSEPNLSLLLAAMWAKTP